MNCKKCHVGLTQENARKRKDVPSGFRPICNPCRNKYERSKTKPKQCENCKKPCVAKGLRSFCSQYCRFTAYYDINPETGCWEWNNKKDKEGYGIFVIIKRKVRAHRVSYEMFNGELESGLFVCHACDNKSCVNPKHLWLGTNQENQQDRFEKKIII